MLEDESKVGTVGKGRHKGTVVGSETRHEPRRLELGGNPLRWNRIIEEARWRGKSVSTTAGHQVWWDGRSGQV